MTQISCEKWRLWHLCLVLFFYFFIGLSFLGCGSSSSDDDDSGNGTTWYKDADRDGYSDGTSLVSENRPNNYFMPSELTAISGDCNDNNAGIFPGNTEIECDGIDQDCDSVDACTLVWYKDEDGDGYSDGMSLNSDNRPSSNYFLETEITANSGDCDDTDSGIHPGQVETTCDGIDQNCDGYDDCPTTWFKDADGDGYSDGTTQTADDQPDNYFGTDDLIAVSGDCNDNDSNIHPGQIDVACDGIDQNCNGYDDCPTTWFKDSDGDRYSDGTSVEAVLPPAGYRAPGILLSTTGDCNDSDAAIYPGRAEVLCDGIDQDCNGLDYCPVTWYKDLDEDNYSDGVTQLAEEQPDGYAAAENLTAISGDCNDLSDAFNPGNPEVCLDRLDNNCDGMVDEACFDDSPFADICSLNQGAAAAAVYDPTDAIHPLRILAPDGSEHVWNITLPEPWIPESVDETQIVVCAGEDYEEVIDTCSYRPSGSWTRYQHYVDVNLLAARTGEVLGTFQAVGSPPSPCPFVIYHSGSSHGNPVTLFDTLDGFRAYVEGSQRSYAGTQPWGVAFDGDDLWVTDTGDNTIKKVDVNGDVLSSFSAPGIDARGIAFDGTHLYVVDNTDAKIYQMNTSGTLIQTFDTPGIYGAELLGICFDGTDLWVLENDIQETVYRVSTSGAEISSFSINGETIWQPRGLTFDGVHFWIVDDISQVVVKIAQDGTYLESIDAPGDELKGLAFDGTHIWVADAAQPGFQRVLTGKNLFQYQEAEVDNVMALCSGGGNLYMAAGLPNTLAIYRLDDTGNVLSFFQGPESDIEGMTFDGSHIWIAPGSASSKLFQYDLSGTFTGERDIPVSFVDGLTFEAPDFWILDGFDELIYQVNENGETNSILNPRIDYLEHLTWDGSFLWTFSDIDDRLYKIDPDDCRLTYFDISGVDNPYGIAFDGSNLWVAKFGTIYRIDLSGNVLDSADITNLPDGSASPRIQQMDHDGTHFWLSDDANHKLYQTDSSGVVLADMDAPGSMVAGIAWDGTNLWVACENDDTIYQLDTSGSILSSFAFPGFSTHGIAWDGAHLLVLSSFGELKKVDTATGEVAETIEQIPGTFPKDITLEGSDLWIAAESIYRFVQDGYIPDSVALPSTNVAGLAHDGSFLWVADSSANIIKKLTVDGTEVDQFALPGYAWYRGITCNDTHFWIIDSEDKRIYQTNLSGYIEKSFSTPGDDPWGLTFDGTHLWTIDAGSRMVYQLETDGTIIESFSFPGSVPRGMTFDGTFLWIADEGNHRLYQLGTDGTLVGETLLPVAEPRGMAYDGFHLWIGNDADDLIFRIDTSGSLINFIAVPGSEIRGMTFSGTHLWVADDTQHRLIQINPLEWIEFP